jgi:hypothetical protein
VTAVRLLGATQTPQHAVGLFPWDSEDYDANVLSVRQALGDDAFAAEWGVGTRISAAEALELALASLD